MYKYLLCWRYLRTRYIALVSIISVTLGVATMIVVNSVMEGFSHEMQERIHGILSDVVFEAVGLDGFHDDQWHMDQIRAAAGDSIEGMTPTVTVPAMLTIRVGDQWVPRQVTVIGIDERTQASVGDFSKYLQHPENRRQLSFDLREDGYDERDHQGGAQTASRPALGQAGWIWRRKRIEFERAFQLDDKPVTDSSEPDPEDGQAADSTALGPEFGHSGDSAAPQPETEQFGDSDAPQPETDHLDLAADKHAAINATEDEHTAFNSGAHASRPPPAAAAPSGRGPRVLPKNRVTAPAEPAVDVETIDPFASRRPKPQATDPATEQYDGLVLGMALASFPGRDGKQRFLVVPGDDVRLTLPTAGTPPDIRSDVFTVVDLYESKMSEYDSNFVFVPIERLQKLRGMIDPETGRGYVTSIQIKLKSGVDLDVVRDKLRAAFPAQLYSVSTWRDKQGPLLAAVRMETAILNVLLFLIIAVAGFGILAIFFMIVVEKTRDIGILKSLGASGRGIMGIFLAYGLLLGIVGSGVGLVLGLLFVANINQIADLLGAATGQEIFDPAIYYFFKIPTQTEPLTVAWIVLGALGIAVLASVLPARRAARLHPVEALRYE